LFDCCSVCYVLCQSISICGKVIGRSLSGTGGSDDVGKKKTELFYDSNLKTRPLPLFLEGKHPHSLIPASIWEEVR